MKGKGDKSLGGSYEAKFKYKGDIARKYIERRVNETKWVKEQEIFSDILSSLIGGACFIDVPLGTGRFIPFYKKYNLQCEGVDISKDMLDEAKKVAASHEYEMRFVQGSADKLPQADLACDYVICARLLNWVPFPTLVSMVREFYRVSRTGLVLEIRVSSELEENTLRTEASRNVINRTGLFIRGIINGVLRRKPTAFYLHDSDSVIRLFDSLGLIILKTHTVDTAKKRQLGLQTHLNIYELRKEPIA